jgi:hypothetical protein
MFDANAENNLDYGDKQDSNAAIKSQIQSSC